MSSLALKTKWALVPDDAGRLCALEDNFVHIEDGLVTGVSSDAGVLGIGKKIVDYGFAVAMPGLINLHCHLDYSNISFGDISASDLFSWIPKLIDKTSNWSQTNYFDSAAQGAGLAALSGTSFVVDNSFMAISGAQAISRRGLKGLVGLELFGSDPSQAESQFASWHERFDKAQASIVNFKNIDLTVSPHAPYTVSPQLWRFASDFARARRVKLLAHVAESPVERDWFKLSQDGADGILDRFLIQAFTRFRNQEGVLDQVRQMVHNLPWRGSGISVIEHLHKHHLLDDNLLAAHCVWANEHDIELCKSMSTSIAMCPISNSLLQNGKAPIEKFIASELKLGLGSDSLASSYSLDLRQAARFAMHDTKIDAAKMLALLTSGAAKALGKENQIGSIEAGKSADILILKVPLDWKKSNRSPFDMALSAQAQVEDLFVDGAKVVSKGNLVALTAS